MGKEVLKCQKKVDESGKKTKKRQKDKKAKRRLMKEAKRCNFFDGINL